MVWWIVGSSQDEPLIRSVPDVCGTTACIQGWGNLLQGMQYSNGDPYTVIYRNSPVVRNDFSMRGNFPLYFTNLWPRAYSITAAYPTQHAAACNLLQDIIDDKIKLYVIDNKKYIWD